MLKKKSLRPVPRFKILTSLTALCVALGGLLFFQTQPASAKFRAYWIPPVIASGPGGESDRFDPVYEKPRKFEIDYSAGGAYYFNNMKWTGWGTKRAVGTGTVDECNHSCSTIKGAKVILTDFFDDICRGDEGVFYRYLTITKTDYANFESRC